MRFILFILLAALANSSWAQQTVSLKIIGGEDEQPVAATILIKELAQTFTADSTGQATVRFAANGKYTLVVTGVGFEEKTEAITIPSASDIITIALEESEELEEVIVRSTRTSRTIANVPTRVETIEAEEVDEKNNMRPANVAMLLHESTGIQVQQTSATSGNASVRIQGLDGRYTQLLKDGFANFGAFSSGLSVLEIPPLDLAQVEIIKGPASPLFGGGAIAGVVNFISRTPGSKPTYNFILNQSNIGQSNVGGFATGRTKKLGYTMLALYNRQRTYDVDGDDFTEVPKSSELTLHPKIFVYPGEKTTITLGNSFTKATRTGGDVFVIDKTSDFLHQYFEKNTTTRNISTLELSSQLAERKRFVVKQSFSVFDRTIELPNYRFAGTDYQAYTDVSYLTSKSKHDLVLGGNIIYNKFKEDGGYRNNRTTTGGVYAQHTLDASEKIKIESGLRTDVSHYSNQFFDNTEVFVLPRISVLVKWSNQWSSRIGGGIGYKTPTLFTEQTETIQYRGIEQLNGVRSERSYGGTADVNFRTALDDLQFSANQLFFYTMIDRPLVLALTNFGTQGFSNSEEKVHTAGFETNLRFIYRDALKLFLGYTFTDADAGYLPAGQRLPLVPKHKLNSALIYEKEGRIKLGLEGYFTGQQQLSDGTITPSFKELGFMAEKIFEGFSVYINFENFTDTRQSRYKNVVNGPHQFPAFDEIWTHTEGFVFNGGVKIRL